MRSQQRSQAARSKRRPAEPQSRAGRSRPYLDSLPPGYGREVLILEWIEFLVERGGPGGAREAIDYYEEIGWVGTEAADQLLTFLDEYPEHDHGDRALTMGDHGTSLEYVAQLGGGVPPGAFDRRDDRDRWLHR